MNSNTLDGVKMLHHEEMRNYDLIQEKIVCSFRSCGSRWLKRLTPMGACWC